MQYGDYGGKSDKYLLKRYDSLLESIEAEAGSSMMDLVHELLEVQRELTLREGR